MGDLMKKHEMTEEDIKLQFITPAIEGGSDRASQRCLTNSRRAVQTNDR